jgi:hypothetical protein
MSIVGTQSVSMQDLMKLGPQALNAMAQGQMKSIAPSYMVIAALKSLTDQQKAQMQPMPGATVKDQVIQQATPPAQAGIGAMAPPPVQRFAEGGSVFAGSFGNETPEETELRGATTRKKFFDWLRGKGGAYDFPANLPSDFAATAATKPAEIPQASYSNEGYKKPPIQSLAAPAVAAPAVAASRTASTGSRQGVGGMGGSPFVRYGPNRVNRKPADQFTAPEMPSNRYLDAALEKYSKPNEARLAEMRKSEKMAGLGAFAEGILQGRGLGGALGPAAAAANRAMESRADRRREFEDRWEDTARELGLKKGTEEYNRARDALGDQRYEQEADLAGQVREQTRSDAQVDAQNRHNIASRQLDAQFAQIREAAAQRRDTRLLTQVNQIQASRQAAQAKAMDQVLARYKENPMFAVDATLQRRAQSEQNAAAAQVDAQYMSMLNPLLKQLGIEAE